MPPAHTNPFRVDRLHALPFIPLGTTWPALLARLEDLNFRGAIVGPHGTGKSTLLATLAEHLRARGLSLRQARFGRESRPRSMSEIEPLLASLPGDAIVLLDGYEQLPHRLRHQLRRRCDRLIITSHRRTLLPTLIRTAATPGLLNELIAQLVSSPADAARLQRESGSLLRRHRGNIREALFELYDRWEPGTHAPAPRA